MANNNENDKDNNKKIPKLDVHTNTVLGNDNYVGIAETVVLHLLGKNANYRFKWDEKEMKLKLKPTSDIKKHKQNFYLTTTKIRNLLSLLNVIQQLVKEEAAEKITDETFGKIQYFKMRCAYEAGRDSAVDDFIEKSNMMDYIDKINRSKKNFEIFFHYVEALVAYHRYYGGRNN